MQTTNTNLLDIIPDPVQRNVQRALADIARLEAERAGYKRLGLGTRFDEDLDQAMAPAQHILDGFRRACARKGIDAAAAIALLGPQR